MKKILMVCLGNICRSPLAEGVFAHLSKNKFHFDSAGTCANHIGQTPDHRSMKVAKKYGITLNHRGRQFGLHDFEHFDEILVMDESNYKNVVILTENRDHLSKVKILAAFDESEKSRVDVPDPYFDGDEKFEEVYWQLVRCFEGWIKKQN